MNEPLPDRPVCRIYVFGKRGCLFADCGVKPNWFRRLVMKVFIGSEFEDLPH